VAFPDGTTFTGRIVAGHQAGAGVATFGAGMVDDETPTADTVVCVSSVGKRIVAACVGVLVLEGVLDGDVPVRQFLPELPGWADSIRLHHLIHHTSGLPDKPVFDIGFSGAVSDWTNETVLGLLSTMSGLEAEPGTTFSYSNVGYVCLATVAERASGRTIPAIAQEHFFAPLGMGSTRFWSGPSLHPPTVTIHPPWYPGLPAPRTVGDGGVWSTLRDLLRWADAMNTGALGDDITDLLHRPGRLRDGSAVPYAWGSFVLPGERGPAYAHGGWWPGCYTYVINVPTSGTAAAIVAFTDNPTPAEALGKHLAGAASE
jgi:CubicO group peptidase (beta-lactamase class C family)